MALSFECVTLLYDAARAAVKNDFFLLPGGIHITQRKLVLGGGLMS